MSTYTQILDADYDEFLDLMRAADAVAQRRGLPCVITPDDVRAETKQLSLQFRIQHGVPKTLENAESRRKGKVA